jgi:hypothetical protein
MDEAQSSPTSLGVAFACLHRLQSWRRCDWLLFWLTGLLVLVLLWLHLSYPAPDLSPEAFTHIHQGMTEEEVEAVIGAPPGGYAVFSRRGETITEEWNESHKLQEWGDVHGYLRVGYDQHGYVCSKRLQYHIPREEYVWDRGSCWERLKHRAIPSQKPTIFYWCSPF